MKFEIGSMSIWFVLFVLVFWPVILAMVIVEALGGFNNTCKYSKVCPHFDGESVTCMKEGGRWSMDLLSKGYANCYLDMQKKYGQVLPLKTQITSILCKEVKMKEVKFLEGDPAEVDFVPDKMRMGMKKGAGKGKGMPGGMRRNMNKGPCILKGPGYGKGAGKGKGMGRSM